MLGLSYFLYIGISLLFTIWVGHTLHSKGRIFLLQNFRDNEALADSINHLLLVGFYLVNLGFILLTLKYGEKPFTGPQMVEFLSTKIGFVVVVLGVMHLINMVSLVKFRNFDLLNRNPETTSRASW
jgi:hypothetical protein